MIALAAIYSKNIDEAGYGLYMQEDEVASRKNIRNILNVIGMQEWSDWEAKENTKNNPIAGDTEILCQGAIEIFFQFFKCLSHLRKGDSIYLEFVSKDLY